MFLKCYLSDSLRHVSTRYINKCPWMGKSVSCLIRMDIPTSLMQVNFIQMKRNFVWNKLQAHDVYWILLEQLKRLCRASRHKDALKKVKGFQYRFYESLKAPLHCYYLYISKMESNNSLPLWKSIYTSIYIYLYFLYLYRRAFSRHNDTFAPSIFQRLMHNE